MPEKSQRVTRRRCEAKRDQKEILFSSTSFLKQWTTDKKFVLDQSDNTVGFVV